MRAFIAIPLPPAIRSSLEHLQSGLRTAQADVKWVRPQQMHLTLKFLGEITPAQATLIEPMLQRVVLKHAGFKLSLGSLGYFRSSGQVRVLWVGLAQGATQALALAQAIEHETQGLGLAASVRDFSAHITLGRVRSPKNQAGLLQALDQATWTPPPAWRAAHVHCYQSQLEAKNPQYTLLSEVPLIASDL